MIKNWTVKTQQKTTITTHINYLKNKNRKSHFYTNIEVLLDNSQGIVDALEDRKLYRKENGLRGGSVRNEATSFTFSLPTDIKQPTKKEWSKIINISLNDMATAINESIDKQNKKELEKRKNPDYKSKKTIIPNVDVKDLKAHCVAVLHDESSSPDKSSHVHLILSNVIKNEVIKPISQYAATHAAKKGFNRAVRHVIGEDNKDYIPLNSKVDGKKPLYVVREEKAQKIEEKAHNAEKRLEIVDQKVSKLKDVFNNIKRDIPAWIKSIGSVLFIAEKKSKSIAENLDYISEGLPKETEEIENVVDSIEDKLEPSETEKVTTKRKRRRRSKKPSNVVYEGVEQVEENMALCMHNKKPDDCVICSAKGGSIDSKIKI